MESIKTQYIKKALKAVKDSTKEKYLKKVLEIDSEDIDAILLLSKFDETYEERALQIAETLPEEPKEYTSLAIAVGIYLCMKRKEYSRGFHLCQKVKKYPQDILSETECDPQTVQSAFAFLANRDDYRGYLPKIRNCYSILLTLFYEYKETNQISESTYLFSLQFSFLLAGFLTSKNIDEPSFPISILNRVNVDLSHYNKTVIDYTIFCHHFYEEMPNFINAYNHCVEKFDFSILCNPMELAILEVLCFEKKTKMTKKSFWKLIDTIKQTNSIHTFLDRLSDKTMESISRTSKEEITDILNSLVNKSIISITTSITPTGIGLMVYVKLAEKKDDENMEAIQKAKEILYEGIRSENPETALACFEESKRISPLLYEADYCILLHKNQLTYDNIYSLYLKCLKQIKKYEIGAKSPILREDLMTYFVSVFLRISAKLITLAIIFNEQDAISFIHTHFLVADLSDPETYILSMFFAIKTNDRSLQSFLNNYDYGCFLPTEVLYLFNLLKFIQKHNDKRSKVNMKIITRLNPYIPAILFDYVEVTDEMLDGLVSINEMHFNDEMMPLHLAANLVDILFLVYENNPLESYEYTLHDYIDEFLSLPMMSTILLLLRCMFTIKAGFTKKEMKEFFTASPKALKEFKETHAFEIAKEVNTKTSFFNNKKVIEEVINTLLLHQIIYKFEDEYRISLFGLQLLTKYFDTPNNEIVS